MNSTELETYKSSTPGQRADIDALVGDTDFQKKKKLVFGTAIVVMIAIFAIFLG